MIRWFTGINEAKEKYGQLQGLLERLWGVVIDGEMERL